MFIILDFCKHRQVQARLDAEEDGNIWTGRHQPFKFQMHRM